MKKDSEIVGRTIRNGDRAAVPRIAKGARFKMSILGAARNPRFAGREGTVVGNSRLNNSVRVLFDGRKTPVSLHRDYIKLIPFESE
jgi:hypothetical protein